MIEIMACISIILFALGYFLGRQSADNEKTEEEIHQLEALAQHYDPVMKEISRGLEDMRKAGLQ